MRAPIRSERVEDAPHWPLAQRCIAVEHRRDRAAGDRAEHEPAAGAGIAEIQRLGRLGETGDTDAADAPRAAAPLFKLCAKRSQRLCGIEHVLAFEQAADPCLADGERPENQRTD